MNSFSKMHRFVRWCVFLLLMLITNPGFSQNWDEHHILNGSLDQWSFSTGIFLPQAYFIQTPDPALGTATITISGLTLTVNFDPVNGAVGVAEFIVEYFPGPVFNFAPSTLAFRLFIDSSHVITSRDYVITDFETPVVIFPLENDISMGGGDLVVEHIAAVENGSADISLSGQEIAFTPNTGFSGMAYITYVAADSLGAASQEKVIINVLPEGELPALDTIHVYTDSRTPVAVNLPAAGFEVDPAAAPQHGSIDSLAPEVFNYTPDDDYNGEDVFALVLDTTYTRVVVSHVIKVDAPNDFLMPDILYTHVDEAIEFDVRLNDLKQSYNINTYTEPNKGTLEFDASTNLFTYTPPAGYSGVVEFEYSMNWLNKYEETWVRIYVGDLAPVNTEDYLLTTHTEIPVVLNYTIPLDGYQFYITSANPLNLQLNPPDNGILQMQDGPSSLEVLCDTVEGFDLLIYTPDEDFTGQDAFEILYCVEPDKCTLVKVKVDVEDFGDLGPCPCVDGCVWPGDANANGIVDMNDLLTVGWNIGYTGDNRDYSDNTIWLGQHAEDWGFGQVVMDVNSKNSDCNGDGVITTEDAGSVAEYFLRRHALIPNIPGLKADYPFYLIPHETVLDSGDMAVIDIVVGGPQDPIIDMHGIHFALNLPTELVDSASIQVEFFEDTWLSHDGASMELMVQPWDGRIDAGFTRIDGKPASGMGLIGQMTFIVEDDIEGFPPPGALIPINIEVLNVGNSDSQGNFLEMDGTGSTVWFRVPGWRNVGLRSGAEVLDKDLIVFPNPASGGLLQVHYNGDEPIEEVSVYDMTGKLMSHLTVESRRVAVDISSYEPGVYVLQALTDSGLINRKFEVLH